MKLAAAILMIAWCAIAFAGEYRAVGVFLHNYQSIELQPVIGHCGSDERRAVAVLMLGPDVRVGCWRKTATHVHVRLEDGTRTHRQLRDVVWCESRGPTCTTIHQARAQ
jgi:hypothetical protein